MRVPLAAAALLIASAGMAAAVTAVTQDATRPSFSEWVAGVRAEALERGVRKEVVDEALAGVEEPLAVVIERDRAQAEVVLPLETYISRQVAPARIRTGRRMLTLHRDLLRTIEETYGVPARYVAAVWGIESNYGQFTGTRPVVAAIATLAWDPRRATRFRAELFDALDILNRGDIEFAAFRGSWAGAMGQPQFLPSSYLKFAVDHDGDGRKDIWSSPADIFGSIANYLKAHGWTTGDRWGREVRVSREAARRIASEVPRRAGDCVATRDMTAALPLAQWQEFGIRTLENGALPTADQLASLISGASRHFLVYGNYDALLKYNCAHAYALSVALLGDRIGG